MIAQGNTCNGIGRSPRASQAAAVSSVFVPEGFGIAIPNNPQDLLKMIQQQHRRNLNKASKHTDIIGRAQKQEQQREVYENKLMEFEDFIYKPEGTERLQRHFEHLRMETEDELSYQLVFVERNKRTVDIKEQVRLEVAERKRVEEIEKEARRKAAEDRRAAVVERLRKKAEEEEKRRLEAEAALMRIKEEGLRKEQYEKDRLATDQSTMQFEDELSHLAEQDFKDRMEKLMYQQREKAKIAEWEKAQQDKDAKEAEARLARMAVLEEKKAKLAELKRLQILSSGNGENNTAGSMITNTRDEAAKLNKQLRIQNKAKFVTKKIRTGGNGNEAEVVSDIATLDVGNRSMHDAGAGNNHGQSDSNVLASVSTVSVAMTASSVPSQEQVAFLDLASSIDSEVELKKMQKELMAEKRALRLEQKQRMSAGSGAQGAAGIEYAKNLRKKIEDVSAREKAVQVRIDKLFAAAQNPTLNATGEGDKPLTTTTSLPEISSVVSIGTSSGAAAPVTSTADKTKLAFSKADQLLREGKQLIQWLAEKAGGSPADALSTGAASRSAPSLANLSKSFGTSFMLAKTDDAGMQRKATMVMMEVPHVLKDIDPSLDPGNYIESLAAMSIALKSALVAFISKEKSPLSDDTTAKGGSASVSTAKLLSIVETPLPEVKPEIAQQTVTPKVNAMHVSSSTSNIATMHARQEDNLLTSMSISQLPKHVDSPKMVDKLPNFVDAVSEDVAVDIIAGATGNVDAVARVSEGDAPEDEDEDGEAQDESEEGGIVFEDIPGWEECLTTTMASAAHHAAFYGYSEVLECLCQYFDCFVMDKKGRTPLFYAALQNHLNCVAALVALDPQWIDVGDQNGDTSLHAAAIANGVGVLRFLLSCEANPDTANYAGLTPCHLARTKEALEELCNAGAQAYCVDTKSRMPLWFACSEGRSDCAEFLCERTPIQYLLWPDEEGETGLHRAAMNGHASVVEVMCQWLQGAADLHAVNRKNYTAAHVASTAPVLKALYENGANLWITDPKGRMPIFMASFLGRADCVAFLLDVASGASSAGSSSPISRKAKVEVESSDVVSAPDKQGDTALHAACMCGHLQCVSLLLYFTRSVRNKQNLTPSELALRAGHIQVAQLVTLIEQRKDAEGLSSLAIFGCEFSMLAAVMLYYGARWSKLYDATFDSVYYLDRATGTSQWERPDAFDEPAAEENSMDKARSVLHRFYSTYNPEKLGSMNDILFMYRNRYTELFISLADKYNVEDLSMFEGVELD